MKARDRIAVALANSILRLASKRYRRMVEGTILYGLRSAARDAREGREPPPPLELEQS